jgi:hypothetical protein
MVIGKLSANWLCYMTRFSGCGADDCGKSVDDWLMICVLVEGPMKSRQVDDYGNWVDD